MREVVVETEGLKKIYKLGKVDVTALNGYRPAPIWPNSKPRPLDLKELALEVDFVAGQEFF
jgi:hypothetical protein